MTFDRQPTLTGPTLRLRPLVAGDREPLRAAAADPLVWEQHPADRHREEEFTPYFDEALASGGALTVRTRDGEVVGTSRYEPVADDPGAVEIGWTFLARSQWGGPANRELKSLMLDHAFATYERVVFHVAPDNLRSRRAVEKLGAALAPEPMPNGWVTYVLGRDAWAARPAPA